MNTQRLSPVWCAECCNATLKLLIPFLGLRGLMREFSCLLPFEHGCEMHERILCISSLGYASVKVSQNVYRSDYLHFKQRLLSFGLLSNMQNIIYLRIRVETTVSCSTGPLLAYL